MADLSSATKAAQKAREWTERRDSAIKAAVQGGASLRAVAAVTGLSHTAIAKIAGR